MIWVDYVWQNQEPSGWLVADSALVFPNPKPPLNLGPRTERAFDVISMHPESERYLKSE